MQYAKKRSCSFFYTSKQETKNKKKEKKKGRELPGEESELLMPQLRNLSHHLAGAPHQ
jgi:hypothetical protein